MFIFLKQILYGLLIGVCMLVPGVSGGSIAVLLGIYDELLLSVSELFSDFKKNFFFLAAITLGGLLGFFLMAGVVEKLLGVAYFPTIYFFMGIILSGIVLLWKKEFGIKNKINIPMTVLGVLLSLSVGLLPGELLLLTGCPFWIRFLMYVLSGILLAAALILPGISFSLILMILGIYKPFLDAIKNLDFSYLIPMGLCIIFGIIVISKSVSYFLKRSPRLCNSMIVGFVLASLAELYPGFPNTQQLSLSILLFLLGGIAPILLMKFKCKSY